MIFSTIINLLFGILCTYSQFPANVVDEDRTLGLPKRVRTCGRKFSARETEMKYYFDYRTGECLGFKYHQSCGGVIGRDIFEYRPECIRSGYSLQDWSIACWGDWQPVKTTKMPCNMTSCPTGTKCRERGPLEPSGIIETVCCNKSLLDLSKNPNAEKCKNGRPVWHGLFRDGMLRPVLAQTCSDMTCHDAYECHQENALFAKCCQK